MKNDERISLLLGMIDVMLDKAASALDAVPEHVLRELEVYARVLTAVREPSLPSVPEPVTVDFGLNEEELRDLLDEMIVEHEGLQLVPWAEDDWRCPVCGEERDFGVAGRVTRDELRPATDRPELARADVYCLCHSCRLVTTVRESAEAFIRDERGWPQSNEIAAARRSFHDR